MTQTQNPKSALRDDDIVLPAVDVIEDSHGIVLLADLPGVPREGLNIQVDGDVLTLEGDIVLPVAAAGASLHQEVGASRFRRAFTLSRELDADRVEAELRNGVLRLRIPKKTQAQARRIEVIVG